MRTRLNTRAGACSRCEEGKGTRMRTKRRRCRCGPARVCERVRVRLPVCLPVSVMREMQNTCIHSTCMYSKCIHICAYMYMHVSIFAHITPNRTPFTNTHTHAHTHTHTCLCMHGGRRAGGMSVCMSEREREREREREGERERGRERERNFIRINVHNGQYVTICQYVCQ